MGYDSPPSYRCAALVVDTKGRCIVDVFLAFATTSAVMPMVLGAECLIPGKPKYGDSVSRSIRSSSTARSPSSLSFVKFCTILVNPKNVLGYSPIQDFTISLFPVEQ